MNKKIASALLILCLMAISNPFKSQVKYWVKFKNKNGTPYTLSNCNQFLTIKSTTRRVYYNIPVDNTDLPVTPAYISQVDNVANVTVLYASKWLNGVVISVPNATLAGIALNTINTFSFVAANIAVNRYKLNLPVTQSVSTVVPDQQNLRTVNSTSYNMGGSYGQNKQINVDCLHNMGYRGKGMTIAVLDVGFYNANTNPIFDSLRNRNGILGTRDFVSGGTSVYEDPAHGEMVLSCMAAIKPGVIMGSAPMADYWLLRTEDANSETPSEEYNWIRGAEFADSVGADILTTSLGYTEFDKASQNHTYATLNGRTAPMSIAANMAARKGMFVLNAAGNEGQSAWKYISVPADADSICTVGAVDTLGTIAYFSSIGPTADGRKKPDLVARGLNSWVDNGSGIGVCAYENGTSFATPILAGAVACFWQMHRTETNMKILQMLKSTASNVANPNDTIGWGIPNVCSIPLGLTEYAEATSGHDFIVSPNPFNNLITITLNENSSNIISVELTDVLGKTIRSVNAGAITGNNVTLNTDGFNEGIYFVKIKTTAGSMTKKIIRQQ